MKITHLFNIQPWYELMPYGDLIKRIDVDSCGTVELVGKEQRGYYDKYNLFDVERRVGQ